LIYLPIDSLPPAYLPVTLSVQSDDQGKLPEFPLNTDSSHYRASLNDRYHLRVLNNSNQRVGLVIAVDGRLPIKLTIFILPKRRLFTPPRGAISRQWA
jgi:hypothetical protein